MYRNTLTHAKELAKKQYLNTQIQNVQHISGLVWKTINIIKYKNIKNQDITVLETEDNKLIRNSSEICDVFNNYFATIGANLSKKLSRPSNNSDCHSSSVTSPINSSSTSLFLQPITVKEVYLHLNSLNPENIIKFKNIKNQDITVLETEDNKLIRNSSEICDVFNNYSATISANLSKKLSRPSNNSDCHSSSVTSPINSSSTLILTANNC